MKRIIEKNRCNGCEACQTICPKNAISMIRDEEGFYFPHIDETKCVNCGMCGKICPVQLEKPVRVIDYNDTKAYGGYIKDAQSLRKSSSGGFCAALADYVQQEGGVVYGTVFSADFREVYYCSSDDVSFEQMRGSKYVTAHKNRIYLCVEEQLRCGRLVLFVGLPCEIAALYSVLGRDYENLLTCELICAGTSSYSLLDEQINWIEDCKRGKVCKFSFRDKKYEWVPCAIYAETIKKKYSKMLDETIFGVGMKYAKREACFNCSIKGNFRVADFTAGDFWKVNKKASYFNKYGTSVIFCRTDKAEKYLKELIGFYFEEVPAEEAINGNRQQLKFPAGVPEERNSYFNVLKNEGGYSAFRKFKAKQSLKTKIRNHLPVPIFLWLRQLETKIKG